MAEGAYELDRLGWLQFEQLCEHLLELEAKLPPLAWSGHADRGRGALLQCSLRSEALALELPGPIAIVIVWARTRAAVRPEIQLRGAIVRALAGVERERVLVLTNMSSEMASEALRDEPPRLPGIHTIEVLGAAELGRCLDRNVELRARMPSVLGLRDLGTLIDETTGTRSTLELSEAMALARVFVPTRAYHAARVALARHHFVVLAGPPEMGKTAIARMLALAALSDGAEAYECNTPEQLWRAFAAERRQLFIADDAFGSTEYRPDAAERWARELPTILGRLDSRHALIWTSRPAPLKAGLRRVRRERGAERFPAPAEVLVDAGALELSEKTLILFRHAKERNVSEVASAMIWSAGVDIVEHPHFTPERIRRFATTRIVQLEALAGSHDERHGVLALVEQELSCPTEAMLASFNALSCEQRELLLALLDAPAGLIDERELTATLRRHGGELQRPAAESIDRLADHFLRVTPLGIGWVHPSWRDLVIDELRHDGERRRRFLAHCGIEGALLALSEGGGAAGERSLPLLLDDADWDQLAARLAALARQLDDHDLARLLGALASLLGAASVERRQLAEARDLAVYLLGCARRCFDKREHALSTLVLAAWFELRKAASERSEPPRLLRTWLDAHPGASIPTQLDRAALTRLGDWLSLARLLHAYDRDSLDRLGFYPGDEDMLVELIPALNESEDPQLAPLARAALTHVAELLQRASALVPLVRSAARDALDPESERWWTPSDIDAPPSAALASVPLDAFTRKDVERVLRDL